MSGERSSAEAPPDDGLNPFSFKEFLRWKALDPDLGPDEERGPEQAHGEVFGVGGVACAAGRPFTSERPQEAEQTGRGRSFQVDMDSSSTCREEEEEETRFSRTAAGDETRSGAETATSWKRRSSGRSSEVTQVPPPHTHTDTHTPAL
ncbi:unnamed protein product [Tetraodon nigroviridis]|uniref:(spotted green pufferfish) hypothetical protein n=1 Tax=Tetraodon nigroviridis TaxID=99883 RepID=Q4T400_TETNG|nr:unnamed protein product [Tetraodon nigroviridis]